MNLSQELQWRNLIKDKTFSDISWLDKPQSFYLGIDASADSLTVGNLAIIILCRRLAAAGWKAYMLMGGGTSLVGDPGGKTEERQLLSRETIISNIDNIRKQISNLFRDEDFTLVDNYDWLSDLNYLEFLRDVGKHFSMTELMQRDFVTERMGKGGSGISYAEFSYSLVQGYDFWHLFTENGVAMQIGGSDQWGNLLSGTALIRKKEQKEAHAMSMPLIINKSTGQKFGKSEAGAIWLDPAKTSPNDFYQFWINVDDEGVADYLKIFTELSKEEIGSVMTEFEANRSSRVAQKKLAYEVTKLVHGDDNAKEAASYAEGLSKGDFSGDSHTSLEVSEGSSVIDALVASGLSSSKSEARQVLTDGGVYINDQPIKRENFESSDFKDGSLSLRKGKRLSNSVQVLLKESK